MNFVIQKLLSILPSWLEWLDFTKWKIVNWQVFWTALSVIATGFIAYRSIRISKPRINIGKLEIKNNHLVVRLFNPSATSNFYINSLRIRFDNFPYETAIKNISQYIYDYDQSFKRVYLTTKYDQIYSSINNWLTVKANKTNGIIEPQERKELSFYPAVVSELIYFARILESYNLYVDVEFSNGKTKKTKKISIDEGIDYFRYEFIYPSEKNFSLKTTDLFFYGIRNREYINMRKPDLDNGWENLINEAREYYSDHGIVTSQPDINEITVLSTQFTKKNGTYKEEEPKKTKISIDQLLDMDEQKTSDLIKGIENEFWQQIKPP